MQISKLIQVTRSSRYSSRFFKFRRRH